MGCFCLTLGNVKVSNIVSWVCVDEAHAADKRFRALLSLTAVVPEYSVIKTE